METPKLKNIVLLILVLTNLWLLVFVVRLEGQDRAQQWQARQEAIQFLADKGIHVEESQIPGQMTLAPQTVERDLERESALAARLLGEGVKVQDRGAGVYRCFNGRGSIQFHSDGSFSAQFSQGLFPLGKSWEKDCLELLAKLDFEGELLEETEETATFRQLWEGQPAFTQQVTLELEGGCVTAMTAGRRLVGRPVEDPSRTTITVATALVEFLNGLNALGDVCSRVDGITQGYVSGVSLSGPMTLTPVWRIATDTGSYKLDLVTGALTRVSCLPAVSAWKGAARGLPRHFRLYPTGGLWYSQRNRKGPVRSRGSDACV